MTRRYLSLSYLHITPFPVSSGVVDMGTMVTVSHVKCHGVTTTNITHNLVLLCIILPVTNKHYLMDIKHDFVLNHDNTEGPAVIKHDFIPAKTTWEHVKACQDIRSKSSLGSNSQPIYQRVLCSAKLRLHLLI